jgi:hypothetical protein
LPGQRLSACTCAVRGLTFPHLHRDALSANSDRDGLFQGESHPGPKRSDGSFVGRSAPEIDVFEATIGGPDAAHIGQVSQSAQWAVRCALLSSCFHIID